MLFRSCKKYGITASLGVNHHSTLVLNVRQGGIDFIENYIETNTGRLSSFGEKMREADQAYLRDKRAIQVNTHWCHEHFSGRAKAFLGEVIEAMNNGNHDRSDIQTDYFDVGWYIDINIGRWNKPYALVK